MTPSSSVGDAFCALAACILSSMQPDTHTMCSCLYAFAMRRSMGRKKA